VAILTPLSIERHAGKSWRKPSDFKFASHLSYLPVTVDEMPRLAARMPIGFIAQNEAFVAVGVLGVSPGRNAYVGSDGRWLMAEVPSALAGHPLRLARSDGGEQVLCIEDEEQNVLEGLASGEPFFDDGGLSATTQAVADFLVQLDRQLARTATIVGTLAAAGLLCRWNVMDPASNESPIENLHRVDESALSGLDKEQLLHLRQAGALPLAYMQLLSMGRLALLRHLALTPPGIVAAAEIADSEIGQLTSDALLRFD
jgi:hypothetical protein